MRVLIVHNDYGNPSGEEHAIQVITDLLKTHGHEVYWFKRSSREILDSFTGKVKAFFTGIHNPFAARRLAFKLDKVKPDIVQVQNLYPLISPSIFKPIKKRNIPIVMRCPNYRLFCPNGLHLSKDRVCEKCLGFGRELWCIFRNCEDNLLKSTGYALRNASARVTKRIFNGVDIFIVQTLFQKQKFVKIGISANRISIVPGLAPNIQIPTEDCLGDLVSFVGRVSSEKGIDEFLNAARTMPDVPFAVAGSYNGIPSIPDKSPSNVEWLGFLGVNELLDLYLTSRLIIVPSRWYEGFPNVIIQAMTLSRPVIAAEIGALSSIVDKGVTGLLFEPRNADDLGDKIRFLWSKPDLCRKMGRAGREKALREYSPKNVYDCLMAVYEKAIELNEYKLSFHS